MPWKEAFKPVEPGQKPPEAPPSLRTWTSQTIYGVFGGMLFGGYRGLIQSHDRTIPSPVPTNSIRHRMAVFFVRESILTGARVGLFTTTFSATALIAENIKGRPGAVSYATAGAFTCGLFAGSVARGFAVPAAAGFGALLGGVTGAAVESLKHVVEQTIDEGGEAKDKPEKGSVVLAVEQLEHSIGTNPLRKKDSGLAANADPQA